MMTRHAAFGSASLLMVVAALLLAPAAQAQFWGYYDSGNFPGHGPPDNYTNQYTITWSHDTALADAAVANGQRLAIFHTIVLPFAPTTIRSAFFLCAV